MSLEKEEKDIPKRKSLFLRHPFFVIFFLCIVIPFAALAFVIQGGTLANNAVSSAAEEYFSQFAHLNINFENLSGNLYEGYTLKGVSVGDKTTPDILTAEKIFIEIDVPESWALQKIVLRGSLDGFRMKESKIRNLLLAAQEEFQLGADPEPFAPLAIVVPKNFSGKDWICESGWKIDEISVELADSEKFIYKFSLNTNYLKEPIQIDGMTELSEDGMPLYADLQLRARQSDVAVQASFEDGCISLKKIEGTLLNSRLSGSALIGFTHDDPKISADLSLCSVDLEPFRKFVPDLGPTTVENLSAHFFGSFAHPQGEFSLKNGNVVWQAYEFSDVKASGILDAKNLSIKFSGNAFGASFEAFGNLCMAADRPLNLEASVPSLQLQGLEKFFPELENVKPEGLVSAKIMVSGTLTQPTARISLRSPKISLQKDYVFSDVGASINATRSNLTLQNFSAEAFKGKIVAIGSLDFDGVSPSLVLHGSLNQLDLSAFANVTGKLDGNFSLGGSVARPQINLEAKIDSIDAAQFGAKNITLAARGGEVLDVQLHGFTKMDTPFGGGGKITLRGARSVMDLKFNLDRLKLSEIFPHTMKISGEINLALLVGGTLESPDISASMRSFEILAGGYKIADPQLEAVLNGRKIDIDASVAVGDRRPSIRGTLDFSNGSKYVSGNITNRSEISAETDTKDFKKGFNCVLDIEAPGLRIDFLAPSLAGKVYGRVTMRSRAIVTESGVEAAGCVTSSMLGASGIHAMNISVPFKFKNKKLEIPDGILTLGDGPVNFKADCDITNGTYTFFLRGQNINLNKLTDSFDLPAQIEGNAEITLGCEVTSGFTRLVRAGGRIRLKDLSIDKFHGQTIIVGNSPLKIKNGNILFKIDDDEIYLMPGSSISAPPDDKIYKFISFTGTLWKIHREPPNLPPELLPEDLLKNNDDMYHILVNGSINLRVLNGLLSGFGAVMDAGASGDMSTENIASSFIQRYITGRIGTQYRAFDLEVAGKDYHELRINHLKFEGEGNFGEVDSTDWRRDSGQVKDYQRYSFNYGLPVGRDPLREEKKEARKERAAAQKKRKRASAAEKAPRNGEDN